MFLGPFKIIAGWVLKTTKDVGMNKQQKYNITITIQYTIQMAAEVAIYSRSWFSQVNKLRLGILLTITYIAQHQQNLGCLHGNDRAYRPVPEVSFCVACLSVAFS